MNATSDTGEVTINEKTVKLRVVEFVKVLVVI